MTIVKMLIIAGYTAHVMTFEVEAILEDPKWQAPVYCFKEEEEEQEKVALLESAASGSSFRKLSSKVINNASNL